MEPLAEWVADSESLGSRWQRLPTNQRNAKQRFRETSPSGCFFFGANKNGGCLESGRSFGVEWFDGGDVTLKFENCDIPIFVPFLVGF